MSIKEIQERHDEIDSQYRVFYVDAAPAHKDRGELLDALREIGELVEDLRMSDGEPCDQYQYGITDGRLRCAVDLKAILDKL